MTRREKLKIYLKKFPKDVLVSREQAQREADNGYSGQLTVWERWDEYEMLSGKRKEE
jgi:hypothetical protein